MSSPSAGDFCHFRVPAKPSIVTCRGGQGKYSVVAHAGASHLNTPGHPKHICHLHTASPTHSEQFCTFPPITHSAQKVTHGLFRGQTFDCSLFVLVFFFFLLIRLYLCLFRAKGTLAFASLTITFTTSRSAYLI